jgi:hypothetical protein
MSKLFEHDKYILKNPGWFTESERQDALWNIILGTMLLILFAGLLMGIVGVIV